MDRNLIEEKLESLRRCLQRISLKCPATAEALTSDLDAQDIVSLNLTRAVQLSVDIAAHLIASREIPAPDTMGQAFDALAEADLIPHELARQLKKAVGFRNLAVHDYSTINWHIVHSICRHSLEDFREFAAAILKLDPL
jgi:uncharacterized protein YutE (UPF0331/DUF86 family)